MAITALEAIVGPIALQLHLPSMQVRPLMVWSLRHMIGICAVVARTLHDADTVLTGFVSHLLQAQNGLLYLVTRRRSRWSLVEPVQPQGEILVGTDAGLRIPDLFGGGDDLGG